MNTSPFFTASLTDSSVSIRDLLHVGVHSGSPNREGSNALFRKQHFQKCADQEETAGVREVAKVLTTS